MYFATRTAFPSLNADLAVGKGKTPFFDYIQLSNLKIAAAYSALVPYGKFPFDFQRKSVQRLSQGLQEQSTEGKKFFLYVLLLQAATPGCQF